MPRHASPADISATLCRYLDHSVHIEKLGRAINATAERHCNGDEQETETGHGGQDGHGTDHGAAEEEEADVPVVQLLLVVGVLLLCAGLGFMMWKRNRDPGDAIGDFPKSEYSAFSSDPHDTRLPIPPAEPGQAPPAYFPGEAFQASPAFFPPNSPVRHGDSDLPPAHPLSASGSLKSNKRHSRDLGEPVAQSTFFALPDSNQRFVELEEERPPLPSPSHSARRVSRNYNRDGGERPFHALEATAV
ncbi:hypothetical protein DIPPA_35843 [Diplonema papillatum]|nr:hypothetical protein DIPPA_35843 [Diplonema papillatum]